MALIGTIRKNSWILIVFIGLGLVAFIAMDATSGQGSLFGGNPTTMGSIEGEKVDYNEFVRVERLLYRNAAGDVFSRRNALWNYFVEEALVEQEAEKLGLGVSYSELMDLQFGPTPSPIINARFADPTTRQLNRQLLNDFKTRIENNELTDPYQIEYWRHQEKEIVSDRLKTKINNMVSKAMYTPTWMVEMGHADQNLRIDFVYVKVPFDELDNTDVTLDNADYKNYLAENGAQYKQEEETRKLDYVVFDVLPTPEDSAKLEADMATLVKDFETTEDSDSNFVDRNYGTIDAAYVKKATLSPIIADTVFNLPIGSVYGPYIDGNAYKAVKVIDRKIIPDSVDSRHILRSVSTQEEYIRAKSLIDSLKNLIETGQQSFDSLAIAFSQDPGSGALGGELGYSPPGKMVKPFNDVLFFEGEEGQLYTVETQFGIHLIEITGRKFETNDEGVKVAYLSQNIVPSEETQNGVYDKVFTIVGQNRSLEELQNLVSGDADLTIETSPALKRNDFTVGTLGADQSSRDMIKWAFESRAGEVAPEVFSYLDQVDRFYNKYVVVGLKSVQKPGLPNVDAVKDEIEQQVINQKKGAQIVSQIQGKDMDAIAAEYDTQIDTSKNVNFAQPFVAGLGNEPKVLATAFELEQDEISQPVIGESGVYIVKSIKKPILSAVTDVPQMRRRITTTARGPVANQLFQAVKDQSTVKDYRWKFY